MKFATFKGAVIHALGPDTLTPLCKQTDANKARNLQVIAFTNAATCHRCRLVLELRDKNSPAARTRRRFAAARQALLDGRQGACQFEKRTACERARANFAGILSDEINKLTAIIGKLEQPHVPAPNTKPPTP